MNLPNPNLEAVFALATVPEENLDPRPIGELSLDGFTKGKLRAAGFETDSQLRVHYEAHGTLEDIHGVGAKAEQNILTAIKTNPVVNDLMEDAITRIITNASEFVVTHMNIRHPVVMRSARVTSDKKLVLRWSVLGNEMTHPALLADAINRATKTTAFHALKPRHDGWFKLKDEYEGKNETTTVRPAVPVGPKEDSTPAARVDGTEAADQDVPGEMVADGKEVG